MLNAVDRFTAMGSPCAIQIAGVEPPKAQQVIQAMKRRLTELEARYTRYREDSLTSKINRMAGAPTGVEVDDETAALLDYAQTAWEQSEGLFDLTSGVLRRAWNFRSGVLPDQSTINELLMLVGWDMVQWEWPEVRLPFVGMEIDFGGVVKEYAVDQLAHLAQQHGVTSGWVDLGGDVAIIGPQPDGSGWRIGLRSPEEPDVALQVLNMREGAVASSGDYERCMVVNGQRYGHVLNPLTGWPVRGVRAVSVLSPHCLIAGTASTVAMLKGQGAITWLDSLGLPWSLVKDDGRCEASLGNVVAE